MCRPEAWLPRGRFHHPLGGGQRLLVRVTHVLLLHLGRRGRAEGGLGRHGLEPLRLAPRFSGEGGRLPSDQQGDRCAGDGVLHRDDPLLRPWSLGCVRGASSRGERH